MRKEVLNILGCCRCKSELNTDKTKTRKGDIRSGNLVCEECGLIFPIAFGRPILMTSNSIKEWQSPVSEAMGIGEYATYDQSIEKLLLVGIDEALKLVEERKLLKEDDLESISEIPEEKIAKIRYRASGKWFKYGNRMERLLTFPWKNGDSDNSFNILMKKIADTQPESLLDIASGGGFAVSHQVWFNSGIKQTIAVERDLKCLGNIQYRFKYVGGTLTSEAVGGDVRQLPVRTESIDTAMMLNALPEIFGITSVLFEAYRVLKKGGYFIVLVSELPFTSDLISSGDFRKFAEGADLYSGYEKFQSDAEKRGFNIESSERFSEKSGKFTRLISLRK